MNRLRLAATIAVLAVVAVALIVTRSARTQTDVVTGVVINVDGGITQIDAFELRLGDGTYRVFVPAADVLFDDGGALGHLREHLVTGEPVEVRFEQTAGGYVAVGVGDA